MLYLCAFVLLHDLELPLFPLIVDRKVHKLVLFVQEQLLIVSLLQQ